MSDPGPREPNRTLLIVDDVPENLQVLGAILRDECRIIGASSGPRALKVLESHTPVLILLDVMMPEMDGFEVIQRIKADPQTADIPVIFITAHSDSLSELRGLQLGAVDYITKPFSAPVVLSRVRTHCALHLQRMDLERMVRERTAALEKALHAAERANQAKGEFLANMSHEMHTPLHGILSFAEMGLQRIGKLSEAKQKLYFSTISTSGQRLLKLLDRVLELGQLESGEVALQLHEGNLLEVAGRVAAQHEQAMADKSISLAWAAAPDPGSARFDPDRLTEVIRNLLSNAIKFCPAGSVLRIAVGEDRDSAGQPWLHFSLTDNGPGIPEEERELVFEKFVRGRDQQTGVGGTGVGLSICRRLVELHGGRIWVEPAPDQGASFHFRIPRR